MARSGAGIMVVAGSISALSKSKVQENESTMAQKFFDRETAPGFEPLVASRAARRATVDERRYLSKIADSFLEAGATVDVMKFLRVHFESKRFVIACARNPFVANAFAPINALTRRFYFVYQRETKDVARAATLHAAVLKAIASGDETAATEAATAMVDYAEYYTRSVIVGRTTIDP